MKNSSIIILRYKMNVLKRDELPKKMAANKDSVENEMERFMKGRIRIIQVIEREECIIIKEDELGKKQIERFQNKRVRKNEEEKIIAK